ncbi:MAG: sulfatase-like hydrolase/transferase [Alphaproteobacteria bacterium]|nr:sulfatase-like hydrolase/transferase [Alphaproteobacteria bacterium]
MWLALLLGCPREEPTPTPVDTDDTASPVPTADTGAPPPLANLLVFLIDDVGPERFAMYDLGSQAIARTPVIDAIAEQGVVFDRAYATPLCSSTRALLLTSRHAYRNGVGTAIFPNEAWELDDTQLTMADALKASSRQSWTTAAFGKWHLTSPEMPGWQSHPNRLGFDHYDGIIQNISSYQVWPRTIDGASTVSNTYHTRRVTLDSVQWLQTAPEPWFAYVPFTAAHAPWHAPPDDYVYDPVADDAPWTEKLDTMIETVDISIGLTLAGLPDGVLERTYVVVVGDNGTPEQVALPPADPDAAKGSLSEGGVRVPMVVAGPGIAPGRTEALASVMDIWPTLAELVGEPLPAEPLDGRSLVPVLADPTTTVRDTLYIDVAANVPVPQPENRGQIVVGETHKLIVDRGVVSFHRLDQGFLEGPDLLPGPLDAADQPVYDALFAEYERIEALTQAEWAP